MNAMDIFSGGKTIAPAVFVESADYNLTFLLALHLLTLLTRSMKSSSVRYFLVGIGVSATNSTIPSSALNAL
jgi:hypothetical protein